jgi:hypothetical protein
MTTFDLEWTRETPNRPGTFELRDPSRPDDVRRVDIIEYDGRLMISIPPTGGSADSPVSEPIPEGREWRGPLTHPARPNPAVPTRATATRTGTTLANGSP